MDQLRLKRSCQRTWPCFMGFMTKTSLTWMLINISLTLDQSFHTSATLS